MIKYAIFNLLFERMLVASFSKWTERENLRYEGNN